jgi:hypothetical protein
MSAFDQIKVLDTHTGGEPTRVVLDGGPELGVGPLRERLRIFREKCVQFRSAFIGAHWFSACHRGKHVAARSGGSIDVGYPMTALCGGQCFSRLSSGRPSKRSAESP